MGSKKSQYIFCLICMVTCLQICSLVFSQRPDIDSMLRALKTAKEDTNKVYKLNDLSWALSRSDPDTAIVISKTALSLAEKQKWDIGIADSYHQIAWANYLQGNYLLSIENNLKALKIRETLKDNQGIAISLGNIANIYVQQGDETKALEYYLKALKTFEYVGDKNKIAACLGNIGIIYDDRGEDSTALIYYFKALKINEGIGNNNYMATNLINIGSVYKDKGDFPAH